MLGLIPKNKPYYDLRDVYAALKMWEKDSVARFEHSMESFAHAKHALAFPYARSAIWALVSLWNNHAERDEVIMPAYTCSVVANPIVIAGLRPVFVDIEIETCNVYPKDVLKKITDKTRAIILVHTHGTVMDIGAVVDNLPRKDILVIEDSALCPKPVYKSNSYDNIVSLYSFDYTKIFSAVEGGIVTTDNASLAERIAAFRKQNFSRPPFRTHMKNIAQFLTRLFLFNKIGYYFLDAARGGRGLQSLYDERSLGGATLPFDFNTLLSAWQARLAVSQIARADEILRKRKERATWYWQELKDAHPDIFPLSANTVSYWSHYPVRIAGRDKKRIFEKMKAAGIEAGRTFNYMVPDLPAFKEYADGNYPNTYRAASEMINLPNYPSISRKDADAIMQTLKTICASTEK